MCDLPAVCSLLFVSFAVSHSALQNHLFVSKGSNLAGGFFSLSEDLGNSSNPWTGGTGSETDDAFFVYTSASPVLGPLTSASASHDALALVGAFLQTSR